MELGFLALLGGLFLILVFIASCLISLKRVSSEDLSKEYLSIGLRELRVGVKKRLEAVEERELQLRKKLAHLDALEKAVEEKLEDPANQYLLNRDDLEDVV
jgi:hypothetical protein